MASRRVLLIAYHYPPIQGSSGVQRTLRFSQYLPEFGWSPVVVTIAPHAYENRSPVANGCPVPTENVHRAFGLDAARHLSVFGRYPRRLALPDRWASWRTFAVRKALRVIAKEPVDAIFSTYPIASAHAIGLELAERTGLPWIAEFRDPMWQGDYPPDPVVNACWLDLEQRVVGRANATVVVTPGAAQDLARRYPALASSGRLYVIENGFDEAEFQAAEARVAIKLQPQVRQNRPFILLHSGVVYPSERDPTQFFSALANLKSRGLVSPQSLRVILRAAGDSAAYRRQTRELGIDEIVEFAPPIGYSAALEEMLTVDGLLVLQASNCNAQIPAKVYEYLRAQRPMLALTDPDGDTGQLVLSTGAGIVARLDSEGDIVAAIESFLQKARNGTFPSANFEIAAKYERRLLTKQLATVLGVATAGRSADEAPVPAVSGGITREG